MRAIILFVSTMLVGLVYFQDVECKKMDMDQIRSAVKGVRKSCQSQIGASKELLDNVAQKGEFPPDPKLQCYLKCVMTMSKAMRNDVLRPDVMKTQAELMLSEDLSERIKKTIDTCFPSVTSSDPCEAAWQFAKCYYETDSSEIIRELPADEGKTKLASTANKKIKENLGYGLQKFKNQTTL